MRVWRICKARFAAGAFSGEGARLFSGRWNPAGVGMVYTSLSLSLAAIEVFVHLEPTAAPLDMVSVEAELPVTLEEAERVDLKTLPGDWRRTDHPALQELGRAWVRSGRSLVLRVPSVAVTGEWNALVNPEHSAARGIKVEAAAPFPFDERMFKRT